MRDRFPAEHFAVNAIYVPAAASCGDERCYGQKLIAWSNNDASCGHNLRVGIVDTAIDRKAPVLKKSRISTKRFHTNAQLSDTAHGTAIASLLVGRKNESFGGMIPKAQLFAADVFHKKSEDGNDVTNATSITAALDWLAGRRVTHINLSLSGPENKLLEAAVAGISARDVVMVAAAGNNGPVGPASYPAAYRQVIAATAVDADLRPYRLANRGDYIDLAAPGVRIGRRRPVETASTTAAHPWRPPSQRRYWHSCGSAPTAAPCRRMTSLRSIWSTTSVRKAATGPTVTG